MSAVYSHAIQWEWTTANPSTSVKQSAKRRKIPEILTIDERVKLLDAIPESFRTDLPCLYQASREEDRTNQVYRLAYVSSHVRHDLERQRRDPKVIQELLRHANLKVTMDTYVQAVSDEKRKAQSKVVEMIMPGIRKKALRDAC